MDTILVISGKVVSKNSKIDWPDLNFPGSGQTILRTLHDVDYKGLSIQLDGPDGPWFFTTTFPQGVAFYKEITN
jgi:hypothetical protein